MPVSRKSTGMSGFSWAAMCSSTADSAPNEETSASRSPSVSIAACRISCGSASRSSAFNRATSGEVSPSNAIARSLVGAFGEGRRKAVGGPLVDVAKARHHVRPLVRRGPVRRLERIDAAADHEARLLAQHVAHRADLAFEAVALAQDAGRRIVLAVQELGKRQGDDGEARQVLLELLDVLVRLDADPDLPPLGQKPLALGLEALQRDDDVAARHGVLVADRGERVLDQFRALAGPPNERRHTQPP